MKILSFDVGIKNLAYCYLEIVSGEYSILEWDVINICKDNKFTCIEIKKNKKPCGNKAKYIANNCYYCKTHAKNVEFKIPTNVEINLLKKIEKNKASIKSLKAFLKKENINFEKKELKENLIKKVRDYLENNYLKTIQKVNSNNLNMISCGTMLKQSLDEYFSDKEIDLILIENQIGPLALRMKMIQGMITQHFIEVGLTNIEFVNAINKLKIFLGNKKTNYQERKKLSIIETRKIIEEKNHNWMEHFNKHSKKDDLADSFLQSLWYIRTKLTV